MGIVVKIELIQVESLPNSKAHKFPIQIAFQTMEFMQGTIFHNILSDTASGQRVRQHHAINEIEHELLEGGMEKSNWEDGWRYLQKYHAVFTQSVRQSVLITLRSHWDWYISHLGSFIKASYPLIYSQDLSNNLQKDLDQIGFKEITKQIDILGKILGDEVAIDLQTREHLNEMSLVRNIGLHNRWEVDQFYLNKTNASGWGLREIRIFEIGELEVWHSALIKLIQNTWKPAAIKFNGAPEYII